MLDKVVDRLRTVPGVAGVVLGGSWARGVARPDSDVDLGLYYRQESPFAISDIRKVAQEFSTSGAQPVVTEFYEWGPWVNGGAWIQVNGGKIDFLYRSLDHVRQVIAEAEQGVWRHDYDQQPPYGFRSVIYLAEARVSVPLFDPHGHLAELKQRVATYPHALRRKIIQDSLWNTEFTLAAGWTAAGTGDVYASAGCLTRVAQYLTQALFAINEEYFITDKNACKLIEKMARHPKNYEAQISSILANPGRTTEQLQQRFGALAQLWQDVVKLADGLYQPRYKL